MARWQEAPFCYALFKCVLVAGGRFPAPRQTLGNICSYAFTILTIYHVTGMAFSMMNESNFHDKMENALHFFGHSLGLVLHLGIRKYAKNLIYFMENEFGKQLIMSTEILRLTDAKLKKPSRRLLAGYCTFHTCYSLSGFITALVKGYKHNNSFMYDVFKCPTSKMKGTLVTRRICWDFSKTSWYQYIIANTLVTINYLTIIFIFGAAFLLYFFSVVYVQINTRVLKTKMEELTIENEKEFQCTRDANSYIQLVKLINFYVHMRRATSNLVSVLRFLATFNLMVFASMNGIIFIILLKQPEKGENLVNMLEWINHVIVFFFYFFLSCYGGEIINNTNDEVNQIIYNVPWYNQSILFQKTIYNFLIVANRPVSIKIMSSVVELRLCMVFLQRMYSVLNVILAQL